MILTLTLRGYQFGKSNHAVYLIDALHYNNPQVLAQDWFTVQTLQYHGVFTWISAGLDRAGVLQSGFLAGYLAILLLMQTAWWWLVKLLGGNNSLYLLAVLVFQCSAAGTGLGMYDFLQDGCFLPSNVSNVAMLWGLVLWIAGRPAWAGLCLGIAGLFHLNFAVAGIGIWAALLTWELIGKIGKKKRKESDFEKMSVEAGKTQAPAYLTARRGSGRSFHQSTFYGWVFGTLALLGLCAINVLPTVRVALARTGGMPLAEFVDLYVRLRHPHHYDPSSWPLALWVTFFWPLPLAVLAWRALPAGEMRTRIARVFMLLCGMQLVALLGAGIFYVSETLVQMSLFRFSIYVKLLVCTGAAVWVASPAAGGTQCQRAQWVVRLPLVAVGLIVVILIAVAIRTRLGGPGLLAEFILVNRLVILMIALLFALMYCLGRVELGGGKGSTWTALLALPCLAAVVLLSTRGGAMGIKVLHGVEDPPDYLALCDWVRLNTLKDMNAVFLVPPNEQEFRLRAQRAIVINFKCVPQLSGELPQWRDRLRDVLGIDDLRTLPHRFDKAMMQIDRLYEMQSTDRLLEVASRYGATYIIVDHPLDETDQVRQIACRGEWRLYHVRYLFAESVQENLMREISLSPAQRQFVQTLLDRKNLFIGAEMARYVEAELSALDEGSLLPRAFFVMGSDARTGVPRRVVVTAAELNAPPSKVITPQPGHVATNPAITFQ